MARIHEARKRALDSKHLVGRIVVETIWLGIRQHPGQVLRDLLAKSFVGVEILVFVLAQPFSKRPQLIKELVRPVRVDVIKVRIVAIDAH